MNYLKIIFGIIIAISAIQVFISMMASESGAGLIGALIPIFLFFTLAAWLIYSGFNGLNKSK